MHGSYAQSREKDRRTEIGEHCRKKLNSLGTYAHGCRLNIVDPTVDRETVVAPLGFKDPLSDILQTAERIKSFLADSRLPISHHWFFR